MINIHELELPLSRLEHILMVPKVFEPLNLYCISILNEENEHDSN